MDLSTVKSIVIPEGEVKQIADANGNVIWKNPIVFSFQDLVDKLVSYGNITGTDEVGFYVESKGNLNSEKIIFDGLELNKQYEVGYFAYHPDYPTGGEASNLRIEYTNGAMCQSLPSVSELTVYNVTPTRTNAFLKGVYFSGLPARVYDFYIEEV